MPITDVVQGQVPLQSYILTASSMRVEMIILNLILFHEHMTAGDPPGQIFPTVTSNCERYFVVRDKVTFWNKLQVHCTCKLHDEL